MTPKQLLKKLNTTYKRLHTQYEKLFWISYMGDHSKDKQLTKAQQKRDAFRSSSKYSTAVDEALKSARGKDKKRLQAWHEFFNRYQVPASLKKTKNAIGELETKVQKRQAQQKEGYVSPKTKKFVAASKGKMRTMMGTEDSATLRRACFEGLQKPARLYIKDYIQLVTLRNEFAQTLGYDDFYDYKLNVEEGMTKKELFRLFDSIYDKTKYVFKDIRKMEKKMPGLRKPWNFSYMLAGDFTKEEDPYLRFEDGLLRWGQSFAAMGITFRGGKLQLDLVQRKGKYSNGFCHWPDPVTFEGSKRIPGSSNFTCNAVPGQVGSGDIAMNTLFHEGGHAAHYLNSEITEVCLNTEFPPASTAWAETQSMFMDTLYSSIEWRSRYAQNARGDTYPFELFERKLRRLHKIAPLRMMGIIMVATFEKEIYESKHLTEQKVLRIARDVYRKYTDRSEDSLVLLTVPHIYAWDSSCSYHAYGLAELAVAQWRAYFYKKYGYIVDNSRVGKEMQKVWKLASSQSFKEFVIAATGKRLSATPYIKEVTMSLEGKLRRARLRTRKLATKPRYTKPIQLDADIAMVHGTKTIATNKKSFEDMAERYTAWLKRQK